MIRALVLVTAALFVLSCAMAPQISPAARSDLTSTGKLRVGINFGTSCSYFRSERHGAPGPGTGSGARARAAARRAGRVRSVSTAGKLADAVETGTWDVAFLGRAAAGEGDRVHLGVSRDPLDVPRAGGLAHPRDRGGRPGRGADRRSAAVRVRAVPDPHHQAREGGARPGHRRVVSAFVSEELEALSGLQPRLFSDVETLPGARVLTGSSPRFSRPSGRPRGAPRGPSYLRAFVEDVKASGFVADAIASNGVEGVSVAPPASAAVVRSLSAIFFFSFKSS